jgi:hypothetical protein
MELSLSPGRDVSLAHLDHLREHSTMWRVSDDLWDRWEDVEAQFCRMARWAPHSASVSAQSAVRTGTAVSRPRSRSRS